MRFVAEMSKIPGKLTVGDFDIALFHGGDGARESPLVCLLTGQEDGGAIFETALEAGSGEFLMAAIPVADWDDALSPWRAPQPFRGGTDFGGGADAFLKKLESRLLPEIRAAFSAPDAPCYLAGYSLAGLFSVYALYRSTAFAGAASVSGSLWFPDFADYTAAHTPLQRPERVYFSLGDRESRTRNPLLRRTEDVTRALCESFCASGTESVFERNPGGHFQEPGKRTARGITWLVRGGRI